MDASNARWDPLQEPPANFGRRRDSGFFLPDLRIRIAGFQQFRLPRSRRIASKFASDFKLLLTELQAQAGILESALQDAKT